MSPLSAEQRDQQQSALRTGVAAVRMDRDVLRVSGADAVSYLQGQVSQDLGRLAPGTALRSLILEPGGKVDAWVRLWLPAEPHAAAGDPEVLIDVDSGAGPALVERLQRFRIRVTVDIELFAWHLVALRGPASGDVDTSGSGAELVTEVDWAGLPGVDLLGPDVTVPVGVPEVDPSAFEAIRIESGQPSMGAELDTTVIPAEAGEWLIEQSVSFTKGCYTGQELVARMDSRGSNTPRKLRGVVVIGPATDIDPPAGSEILVGSEARGVLTSVGRSAALGDAPVGLAYVHRSVEPAPDEPVAAELRWQDASGAVSSVAAEVRTLPLVGGR